MKKIIVAILGIFFLFSCGENTVLQGEENIGEKGTVKKRELQKYAKLTMPQKITVGSDKFLLGDLSTVLSKERSVYKSKTQTQKIIIVDKYLTQNFSYYNAVTGKIVAGTFDSLEQFFKFQTESIASIIGLLHSMDIKDELKNKVDLGDFGLVYSQKVNEYGYEDAYTFPEKYELSYYHYDGKFYYRISFLEFGFGNNDTIKIENRLREFKKRIGKLKGVLHSNFIVK